MKYFEETAQVYFETIKCYDYEVFNLSYHSNRIANSIGLNLHLEEYIYPPSEELLRCKLIYDESGILELNYFPYNKRKIKSFKIVYDDEVEYSCKYLNRDKLDELFSKKDEADEIIVIKNGFVTDTSIANIAIFDGINWLTPKTPLLKGTSRARYLKKGVLIEKDISVEELKSAKKIALLNAMIDFDILEDYSFFL